MSIKRKMKVWALVLSVLLCLELLVIPGAVNSACSQYVVTGFRTEIMYTGTVNNARSITKLYRDIALPLGAVDTVIVSMSGFHLGYGSPVLVATDPDTSMTLMQKGGDNDLRMIRAEAYLHELTPSSAKIRAELVLGDNKLDDKWYGYVQVKILFLKCCNVACGIPTHNDSLGFEVGVLRSKIDSIANEVRLLKPNEKK